jgi:hypothetical protein
MAAMHHLHTAFSDEGRLMSSPYVRVEGAVPLAKQLLIWGASRHVGGRTVPGEARFNCFLSAARSTSVPREYTREIRRVLAMLSSGFASSTRKALTMLSISMCELTTLVPSNLSHGRPHPPAHYVSSRVKLTFTVTCQWTISPFSR